MRARAVLIVLSLAGASMCAVWAPAARAAEAPATTPAPAETGTTATPQAPAQTPTITVEPAPTPPPVAPPRPPQPGSAPRVHVQHAQGTTRGAPAHKKQPSGEGAAARRGPRAPLPSALTPQLPLAFSTSLRGIPTFFIESLRIPPFLLPIFQAAGTAYGVPWQVLAAINEVETDYGRDLSVSSAGAEGWMQFLPSSWAIYGVDANGDGFKDPYNPADAIFAAGRYLRAAGAAANLHGAIYAYNHSQAYVESVLLRARLLGGTPQELVGALTGLTQSRFPVHAPSHFADGFVPARGSQARAGTIPATTIYSQAGAPVIAVQDGQIARIGDSPELGRFISLRDAYGNTYTYAQLGGIARFYPVLAPHEGPSASPPPARTQAEPRPSGPASAGVQPRTQAQLEEGAGIPGSPSTGASGLGAGPTVASPPPPSLTARVPTAARGAPAPFRAGPNDVYLHPLRRGARVIAGTILGDLAGAGRREAAAGEPHMIFQIRPAGPGAPLIDPKPILDGWVALENTSIYRASGANPYVSSEPSPGQVLLESKQQLEVEVLAGGHVRLGRCGRDAARAGLLDRRVLATVEFLAVSGLSPTVSGLRCARSGEGVAPTQAFDISAVNGTPIAGHQGPGSIADQTMRKLIALQGALKPRQIAASHRYPGSDNTVALAAYRDRLHVDFAQPPITAGRVAGALGGEITASEWIQLIARLGQIPNPSVRSARSAAAIPDHLAPGGAGAGGAGGHG
jgi:hypothetical protein